jgi:hypothetical protein
VLCKGSRTEKNESAFALYDCGGSGYISLEEMTRYLTSVYRIVYETQPETGDRLSVGPEELAAVTAEQAFKDADLNHDGKLSLEEFKAWYSKQEEEQKAPQQEQTERVRQAQAWQQEEEQKAPQQQGKARSNKKTKLKAKKAEARALQEAKDTANAEEAERKRQDTEDARVAALRQGMLRQRAEEERQAREWELTSGACAVKEHAAGGGEWEALPTSMPAIKATKAHAAQQTPCSPQQPVCECPVCFEDYLTPPSARMPVSLPCGHSLCQLCAADLQGLAPDRQHQIVQCPECRKVLPLPPGGVSALPCNYSLMHMAEALEHANRESQRPVPAPPAVAVAAAVEVAAAAAAPPAAVPVAMAAARTITIPARIAALEALWDISEAVGRASSYRARISALEMLVAGETSAGTLPGRVAELEQLSGC